MRSIYIEGDWKQGHGSIFERKSPCTNESLYLGPSADASDTYNAISFCCEYHSQWASLPLNKREDYLNKFSDLLLKRKYEIATLIRDEIGKPFWEALLEVESTANKAHLSISAHRERIEKIELSSSKFITVYQGETIYRSLGCAAVIGPFNLPLHLPNAQIMPALLAGNCVLFKPSELAPSVAEAYMRVWTDIGLPGYALQLLQGGRETAESILTDSRIKAVYFTGSYETGTKIAKQSLSIPGRMVALEMGGNNPLIVAKSAQNDKTALITAISAFITSGQRCTCARRLILVKSPQSDLFISELISVMNSLQVAIPSAKDDPFMGPLVTEAALEKTLTAYEELKKRRVQVLVPPRHICTSLLSPGLVETTGLKIEDEEIFGPLLQLIQVEDFEEALHFANASEYGLVSGVLTQDDNEWIKAITTLKTGIINRNCVTVGASGKAPFGGIGKSGNYRPAGYFACDSCAYPVAITNKPTFEIPSFIPSKHIPEKHIPEQISLLKQERPKE